MHTRMQSDHDPLTLNNTLAGACSKNINVDIPATRVQAIDLRCIQGGVPAIRTAVAIVSAAAALQQCPKDDPDLTPQGSLDALLSPIRRHKSAGGPHRHLVTE